MSSHNEEIQSQENKKFGFTKERVTFCGRPTKDNEGANDGGNTCWYKGFTISFASTSPFVSKYG